MNIFQKMGQDQAAAKKLKTQGLYLNLKQIRSYIYGNSKALNYDNVSNEDCVKMFNHILKNYNETPLAPIARTYLDMK